MSQSTVNLYNLRKQQKQLAHFLENDKGKPQPKSADRQRQTIVKKRFTPVDGLTDPDDDSDREGGKTAGSGIQNKYLKEFYDQTAPRATLKEELDRITNGTSKTKGKVDGVSPHSVMSGIDDVIAAARDNFVASERSSDILAQIEKFKQVREKQQSILNRSARLRRHKGKLADSARKYNLFDTAADLADGPVVTPGLASSRMDWSSLGSQSRMDTRADTGVAQSSAFGRASAVPNFSRTHSESTVANGYSRDWSEEGEVDGATGTATGAGLNNEKIASRLSRLKQFVFESSSQQKDAVESDRPTELLESSKRNESAFGAASKQESVRQFPSRRSHYDFTGRKSNNNGYSPEMDEDFFNESFSDLQRSSTGAGGMKTRPTVHRGAVGHSFIKPTLNVMETLEAVSSLYTTVPKEEGSCSCEHGPQLPPVPACRMCFMTFHHRTWCPNAEHELRVEPVCDRCERIAPVVPMVDEPIESVLEESDSERENGKTNDGFLSPGTDGTRTREGTQFLSLSRSRKSLRSEPDVDAALFVAADELELRAASAQLIAAIDQKLKDGSYDVELNLPDVPTSARYSINSVHDLSRLPTARVVPPPVCEKRDIYEGVDLKEIHREGYIQALATARAREVRKRGYGTDMASFFSNRVSRNFTYTYFCERAGEPDEGGKRSKEKTEESKGVKKPKAGQRAPARRRAGKNTGEMAQIFGDIRISDYYPGGKSYRRTPNVNAV